MPAFLKDINNIVSHQFTHHLIAGRPHHPGQNIEEVLPLQKLQQATRNVVRADVSGDTPSSVQHVTHTLS